MGLDYILLAAKTMREKGEKEAARGLANAASSFLLAAKKYREAASLDTANSQQYVAMAEECEAKSKNGVIAKPAPSASSAGGNANRQPTGGNGTAGHGQKNAPTQQSAAPGVAAKVGEDLSVDAALEQLNGMIGLGEVKSRISDWVAQINVFKQREKAGLAVPDGLFSYHLLFTGNPGTGKTTVARIMAQIYHSLGILPENKLVETSRSDLVGGYVGQTAIKTQEVVNQALGGVLFVDEAYMLNGGGSNDFGQEAIDTLLKAMEDHRNELVVIMAGYSEPMEKLIETNPGLRSRFNNVLPFSDYSGDELFRIFADLCKKNQWRMTASSERMLRTYFDRLYAERDENFGNGRTVRNFFQTLVMAQSKRLNARMRTLGNAALSAEEMTTFTEEDVRASTLAEDDGSAPYERTKAEINESTLRPLLESGAVDQAAVSVCVRLESLLIYVYKLNGNLAEMIHTLGTLPAFSEKGLKREDLNLLHKIRLARNGAVHAGGENAQSEPVTAEDIRGALRVIQKLEQ